jgi:hypothetical protein
MTTNDNDSHACLTQAQIRELKRELRHEKGKLWCDSFCVRVYSQFSEKNRLLKAGHKLQETTRNVIPKPKGSVGNAGYSLIAKMQLDPEDRDDKILYNDILVSIYIANGYTYLLCVSCTRPQFVI